MDANEEERLVGGNPTLHVAQNGTWGFRNKPCGISCLLNGNARLQTLVKATNTVLLVLAFAFFITSGS